MHAGTARPGRTTARRRYDDGASCGGWGNACASLDRRARLRQAHRARLPRQAVESTKRLLNVHLERAVLASLDFATTAEEQSFGTEDFRSIVAKLAGGETS